MRDGPFRRLIKRIARALYLLDRRAYRALLRARGEQRYQLAGECQSCARCCEEPTVSVHPVIFHFAPLRALFVAWQWHVNRFAFVRAYEESSSMAFQCAHFDWKARRCDSYESRPGVCWDYPRFQLDQPWPELFEQCGYRAVDTRGEGLSRALDGLDLPPEEREKLKRKLHVLR